MEAYVDRKCSLLIMFQLLATIARMGLDVTNVAASLAMSVENANSQSTDPSSKQISSTLPSHPTVTSAAVQAAAQQVLQNRVAEAQQVTGVTLPSFYNPAAVNPMKYAQQIQKRKLLWSKKVRLGDSFSFIARHALSIIL